MRTKKSYLLVSGPQLRRKFILVSGSKSEQQLQFSSRRIILGVIFRNLKLEYLALNPSFIGMIKILILRIVSLSKQIGLRNTLAHFAAYKVYIEPSSEVKAKSVTIKILNDNRPIWVSRVAILGGVVPYSLNHSQEYDFARFQPKFSCFLWDFHTQPEERFPKSSTLVGLHRGSRIELCGFGLENELSFHKLQGASIFHGRTVVCDGEVIPSDLHNFIDGSWPSDFVFKCKDNFYLFQRDLDPDSFDDKFIFFGTSTSWFHFLIEIFPRYLQYDQGDLMTRIPLLEEGVPTQIVEVLQLVTERKPLVLNSYQNAVFHDLVVCIEARYPRGLDLVRRAADIQLVRSFFVSRFDFAEVQKSEKVFITRDRNLFRRSDIVNRFADFCSGLGFVVIDPGQMSMQQQIELFSSAKVIVAETGSSLTNLLFCEPGATVVEINLHRFMAGFFNDFCNVLNLSHFEVSEIESTSFGFSVNVGGEMIDFTTLLDRA